MTYKHNYLSSYQGLIDVAAIIFLDPTIWNRIVRYDDCPDVGDVIFSLFDVEPTPVNQYDLKLQIQVRYTNNKFEYIYFVTENNIPPDIDYNCVIYAFDIARCKGSTDNLDFALGMISNIPIKPTVKSDYITFEEF